MLSVENLAYHYKGRPAVLKDVNFSVNTGEFLAILGNNGVGKSTMLKCFNKILTPDLRPRLHPRHRSGLCAHSGGGIPDERRRE